MNIKFSVLINNEFGAEANAKFDELIVVIIEYARELDANGIYFSSSHFQNALAEKGALFLRQYFKDVEFEFFFVRTEDHIYFIVNNIIKHAVLYTFAGRVLHDQYKYSFTLH